MVVKSEDVPSDAIDREREIFIAQAKETGKPENIIEKIVSGQIRKYLSEISLNGQPFVKNPDQTVGELLKAKEANVERFVRYEVGEGIEVKKQSFEEEVAQARGSKA